MLQPHGGSPKGGEEERRPGRTAAWDEKVLVALRAYKEVNGDALVPQSFIVPSDDTRWPRVAWGYGLGKAVSVLRARATRQELSARLEAELKALNFSSNVKQFQWDEVIMPALRHFYAVNGHTDVCRAFVVPDGDDAWPQLSWNWALGNTVNSIRSRKSYARQVEQSKDELNELKFCFDTSVAERDWNEMVLPALKVYRQMHHHCIVETVFKVPRESPWPEEAWDLHLGSVVNSIRVGKNYVQFAARDEDTLKEIGFAWDRDVSTWSERIFPAIETYVAEFNTCRIPTVFVVPACEPWPKTAWGMGLGKQVYTVRYRGNFFVDRLKALGFTFELRRRALEKFVDPLLGIYEATFGDRVVPHDFVIPSEASWPDKMWGVHLGVLVASNSWAVDAADHERP